MKKISKKIGYWTSVAVLSVAIGVSLQMVKAWTEPPIGVSAPAGNVAGPVNLSSNTQTKAGAFVSNNYLSSPLVMGGFVYSSGNITGVGDVKGARLCIGSDCRDAWPSGGGSVTWGDLGACPCGTCWATKTVSTSCDLGTMWIETCMPSGWKQTSLEQTDSSCHGDNDSTIEDIEFLREKVQESKELIEEGKSEKLLN